MSLRRVAAVALLACALVASGCTREDDATDAPTWYEDVDGDGYGDASSTTEACDLPAGYVAHDTDCDDTKATIFPDADEVCNEVDDNCDGEVDESTAIDAETWHADRDGDGYGDASSTSQACVEPTGYVADNTDCDDADADVYPNAPGLAEDCEPVPDGTDSGGDTAGAGDDGADKTGCDGCATGTSPSGTWGVLALSAALMRRRSPM